MTNRPHRTLPDISAERTETERLPGWPEIVAGLGAAAAVMGALVLLAPFLPTDPVAYGLTLAAWSAAVGFVGFGVAFAIRIRSLAVFGVRRTTWRWLLIGVGAGIVAFLLKGAVNAGLIALGFGADAQVPFQQAGNGGVVALIVTFVCLSFLVPFGEELLFRGVLMRGLLRYGAVVAVLGSSVVFALFHGINLALPTAIVVGIIAAEVARRSGSIWPAVAVHVVNNLALPVFVLFLGLGSGV
ncbi:CPBP family intramembrane glutamic endopeptidase [Microbacterium sp. SA39]|uniref:CPBP family intramembrane glutamic endopeptidase n=1 Tax=Microbacterium sp. SA39 TaxID=1263625 RepID=UPI00061E890D|nr:type II CAAX endopeptidase family protein [Microbacterium sp. SA39]KJQ52713.1 CAAX amino terminal protease self- immunity [Microbacterium sp. SA39]